MSRYALILLALAALSTGCSTLGVRVDTPRESRVQRQAQVMLATTSAGQTAAGQQLAVAADPALPRDRRMAALVEAARLALPGAAASPASGDAKIYRLAVRGIVAWMGREKFVPETLAGAGATRTLALAGESAKDLDPRQAESLTFAGSVRIRGLLQRTVQEGLGVPYVAYYPQKSPYLAGQPGIPDAGMTFPVTAVVTFQGSQAVLSFRKTLVDDLLRVASRRVPLAADFSAPIAILLSYGKNRSIDIQALFFTRQKFSDAGLAQMQPYDPHKIPVIFVHGLLSRPEAWTQAVNALLGDPTVREHYQFWFYLYPTGLPVWQSAAKLRTEMDRFQKALDPQGNNPAMHKIVLVGHSMGGLICSLMVRSGGDALWRQFSDVPASQLRLSPKAKEQLLHMVYFLPRQDVRRVIFVATPHRGSNLALNPAAEFFARLIQLPFSLIATDRQEILRAMHDNVRDLFVAPTNSIRFLRAHSPLLLSILKLPLSDRVTYYSIIGDRGRGDTPNSSDGVVPYWSSHLDQAVSEKIVPSGHGANENPQGIEEIRRILVEAVKKP